MSKKIITIRYDTEKCDLEDGDLFNYLLNEFDNSGIKAELSEKDEEPENE